MNNTFRTLVIMLTVAGVCFTTSCKKKTVNGKVKQVVTTSNGQTTTTVNTYDSQGRLIAQSGGITISYSQSNVTITRTTGTPTVYTLNNQGYAGSDNSGITYTYDDNGFLINEVVGTSSRAHTISNGDEVSTSLHTANGTTTTTYTYLGNIDYRDYGLSFLGRNNAHVKNIEIITAGGTSVTYTYSYNFDGDGRVVTQNVTGSDGSNSSSTYSY